MTRKLGDIEYNENEYLRQDKDYDMPQEEIKNFAGKAELHIIDIADEKDDNEEEQEEEEQSDAYIENTEIEAKFVAKKINEIIKSDYYVFDKKEKNYRKSTYRDIVILLRATTGKASIFEKELSDAGIPTFSDSSSEYLNSLEIQTILSLLKVIDNPLNDIALVSTLRSYIGGFTDNELIKIRLFNKSDYFYIALKNAQEKAEGELLKKVNRIFDFLDKCKKEQEYLSLEELIWNIYMDTGYYHYVSLMPDGNIKIANLKLLLERAKQYEEASLKGLFNFICYIEKIRNNSGDLESAKIIGENENVVRIMSIHKSKGLEFPIVFLCDTGKKFNLKDLNEKLLMHHEIGFGPDLIDTEKGIEYHTLAKKAIRLKARIEAISEEMRVLYVALTRSREKLIITGIDKNYKKSIQKKEMYLQINKRINEGLLQKYVSYLDWLELISIAKEKELQDILENHIINKEQILKELKNSKDKKDDIVEVLENNKLKNNEKIEKLLNWKYGYISSTKIPSKTSITEIKQKNQDIDTQEKSYIVPMPIFLKETKKLSASQKGSAMHLFLQKLDFKKNYTNKDIRDEIEKMVANQILTKMEAESISIEKVEKFLSSKLVEEMKNAKEIYKETPFYMNLTAREALLENVDEKILIQGIIDLFYVKQDGDIVLVDYKTDYLKNGEEDELVKKHKLQLQLYKRAIEESVKKKVAKVYIYSVYLGKVIEVN